MTNNFAYVDDRDLTEAKKDTINIWLDHLKGFSFLFAIIGLSLGIRTKEIKGIMQCKNFVDYTERSRNLLDRLKKKCKKNIQKELVHFEERLMLNENVNRLFNSVSQVTDVELIQSKGIIHFVMQNGDVISIPCLYKEGAVVALENYKVITFITLDKVCVVELCE